MNKNQSKYISYLLRHAPEKANLTMSEQGWVSVNQLLKNTDLLMSELEEIVANNNKKRFEFNEDKSEIRARQGHSIKIDLGLEEKVPPLFLYHGTAKKNFYDIWLNGLIKMKRHHVHLSPDKETAVNVGQRHGKPLVLKISTKEMYDNGFKFYQTENNVWLVDVVPVQYILVSTEEDLISIR